jgi:DNA repair exonuclease SbcCD nuclease subunit
MYSAREDIFNEMRYTLGHTSDWHILSTQYGNRFRADAVYNAAKGALDTFFGAGVMDIVNSGDILDSAKNGSYPIALLDKLDNHLKHLGMRMFSVTGNHDMDDPPWLDKYIENRVGIIPIDNRRVQLPNGCNLIGVTTKTPAEFLTRLEEMQDVGPNDIGVWHGPIKEFMGGGKYISIDDILSRSPIGLWLMGDVHIHRYITVGDKTIGYPGPVDMTDINEDPIKKVELFHFDGVKRSGQDTLVIRSTPVFELFLRSEDDLADCVQKLSLCADGPRFVWLKYDNAVEHLIPSLEAYLRPTDVLRRKNITEREVEVDKSWDTVDTEGILSVAEIVNNESAGMPSSVAAVLRRIAVDKVSPQSAIETFVAQHETEFV